MKCRSARVLPEGSASYWRVVLRYGSAIGDGFEPQVCDDVTAGRPDRRCESQDLGWSSGGPRRQRNGEAVLGGGSGTPGLVGRGCASNTTTVRRVRQLAGAVTARTSIDPMPCRLLRGPDGERAESSALFVALS
jgi:hypothetical protein